MSTHTPERPSPDEYDPYFEQYLQHCEDPDILESLHEQTGELRGLFESAPVDQMDCLHEPYTWSLKQVLGHLIDNERIFGYRAARFASGDSTDLPGYDQNQLTDNAGYERCTRDELLREFEHLRSANLCLFRRLTAEQWQQRGIADGKPISVRAVAWLLVGHIRHHIAIINTRLTDAA